MPEMPESERAILNDVEFFKDRYFTYDEPVPFIGNLMLYPVTVRNYHEFLSGSSCLTLNKNDDPKGIRMSHLGYLLSKMEDKETGQLWCYKFTKILELCLHVPSGLRCKNCGKLVTYLDLSQAIQDNPESPLAMGQCECGGKLEEIVGYKQDEKTKKPILVVDGNDINGENFNRMRKYIMYQNLPDFKDDSYVNQEIREDQAALHRIKSQGQATASLERQIICVSAKSSYKINEIYDMSIRKFTILLSVINDAIEYEATKMGLMTGMVSLKKGETIDHWIYKKEGKDIYDKAVDADAYSSEIQNA